MRRRYIYRPGAYVILPRAGRLLLTHQAEPTSEIQLPGGGIDSGEQPIPALHREVLEETGWTISDVRRLSAYRRFTFMAEYKVWAEKICHVYVAHPVRSVGPPLESGHTAIWLDPDNAVEVLESPGDRDVLAGYLSRACGR